MRALPWLLSLAMVAVSHSAGAQETTYEVRKPIRGLGVTPLGQPEFSATDLTVTGTAAGQTAAAKSVVMTNIGEQPLGIAGVGIQGGDGYNGFFLEGHSCGEELASGQSCAISVSAQIPDGARLGYLVVGLRNSWTRTGRIQLQSSLVEPPPR